MKKIIVLMSAALVIILSGCNSNSGDPKEVLGHFFDAMSHKNIDEAKKYVTKDSEGMMGMMQMGMNSMDENDNEMPLQKENMEIGNAVITGDRATVPVKDKKTGETTDFVLKKESGAWKVAFDKSTLMEMGQKKMKEHGMGSMQGMDSMKHNMNEAMDSLNAAMPDMKDKMEHAQKMMDSARKMMEKRSQAPQ